MNRFRPAVSQCLLWALLAILGSLPAHCGAIDDLSTASSQERSLHLARWLRGSSEEILHAVSLIQRLTPADADLLPTFLELSTARESYLRINGATGILRLGVVNDDVRRTLGKLANDEDAYASIQANLAAAALGTRDRVASIHDAEARAVERGDDALNMTARTLLFIGEPEAAARVLWHTGKDPIDPDAESDRVLWRRVGSKAVPVLIESLRGDATDQLRALQRLADLGPIAAAAAADVRGMLITRDSTLLIAVIETLGQIGVEPEACADALIPLLDDKRSEVSFAVAVALARFQKEPERVLPVLIHYASDSANEDTSRRLAISAIGHYGAQAAMFVPDVIIHLRDEAGRKAATWTLRRIGDAATPALLPLLEDRQMEVRIAAAESLEDWRDEKTSAVLVHACRNGDLAMLRVAALSEPRHPAKATAGVVDALVQATESESAECRQLASLIFAKLGVRDSRAVAALTKLIKDDDPLCMSLAMDALWKIGPPASPAYDLIEACADRQYANSSVPQALSRIDAGRSLRSLPRLFVNSSATVRHNALLALRQMGPAGAPLIPEIREVLKQPRGIERVMAAAAWLSIEPDNEEARKVFVDVVMDARWGVDERGFGFSVALFQAQHRILSEAIEPQARQWTFDVDPRCADDAIRVCLMGSEDASLSLLLKAVDSSYAVRDLLPKVNSAPDIVAAAKHRALLDCEAINAGSPQQALEAYRALSELQQSP